MNKKLVLLIIVAVIVIIVGITLYVGMQKPVDQIDKMVSTKFELMSNLTSVGYITQNQGIDVLKVNEVYKKLPAGTTINYYTDSSIQSIDANSNFFANSYDVKVKVIHKVYQVENGAIGTFELQNNQIVPENQSVITTIDNTLQPLNLTATYEEIWQFKFITTNNGLTYTEQLISQNKI